MLRSSEDEISVQPVEGELAVLTHTPMKVISPKPRAEAAKAAGRTKKANVVNRSDKAAKEWEKSHGVSSELRDLLESVAGSRGTRDDSRLS